MVFLPPCARRLPQLYRPSYRAALTRSPPANNERERIRVDGINEQPIAPCSLDRIRFWDLLANVQLLFEWLMITAAVLHA
jgi:hypothetical protein